MPLYLYRVMNLLHASRAQASLSQTCCYGRLLGQGRCRRQQELECFKAESDLENRVSDFLVYSYNRDTRDH